MLGQDANVRGEALYPSRDTVDLNFLFLGCTMRLTPAAALPCRHIGHCGFAAPVLSVLGETRCLR